jgi:hypothetical protein
MVTNGIKVSEYRPEDQDDEVDIRVRFPYAERNLDQLDQLRRNMREEKILDFLLEASTVITVPADTKESGTSTDRKTPTIKNI